MKLSKPKKGLSIFVIQTTSYLLVILIIAATFGFFLISTAKNNLENEVGRKLQDIARIAARNAPFERLNLIKEGDEQSRMVLRLKEKLGEIREATGARNIYIFRPDRSSLIDLNPVTPIATVYQIPHFQIKFLVNLENGEALSTGSYRGDEEKLLISAFAPVLDREGELFAIVGVDAGTREIEVIEKMNVRLILISIAGALFAILLSLLLARRISNPIRQIAKTAQEVGEGQYEARVPISSPAELATLARSLNAMAEQIQDRDAKLKEMTATIAHEIRNPLNSINLLITLLDEELTEQNVTTQQDKVRTLHYEIGKLNRLLTEFLTYSRPLSLNRERISPEDIAKSAVAMSEALSKERNVAVQLVTRKNLPDLTLDRQRMEQALLDIVLNGIQASHSGGQIDLAVQEDQEENFVEYVIKDTGPGISHDTLPHIFDPFFTTKEAGSGLGLSNVKKIVTQHGGEVFAGNRKGKGAYFIIRLPLNNESPDED